LVNEFGDPKRAPEILRFRNEPQRTRNGSLYFSAKAGTVVNRKAFSIITGQNRWELGGDPEWKRFSVPLHVLDHVIAEFAALDLGRALHLAREIVGDAFAGDRAVEAFEDQIRRVVPTHVAEHHFAGENH